VALLGSNTASIELMNTHFVRCESDGIGDFLFQPKLAVPAIGSFRNCSDSKRGKRSSQAHSDYVGVWSQV